MERSTIIVIILIIIVAISSLFYFWLAPVIFFAQVDSAHDIIEKTYDADNALYNYEWFKTRYEEIQAKEIMIDNLYEEKKDFLTTYGEANTWNFQIQNQYSILSKTITGTKNHYQTIVAEYNARSKMANRNIFIDGLPYDVDKKLW